MGRKQRDLDISSGPVAAFAAQLRATREAAGNPTFATMSRRAHRSISALSEAAGGVEFPTWATVEAFVHACGETDTTAWRERWEATQAAQAAQAAQAVVARRWDAPPGRRETADPAAETPAPGHASPTALAALTAAPSDVPRRRMPPWSGRLRTVVALALGLAVGVPVGALLPGHSARGAAAVTVAHPMPSVVLVPAPSPAPWPAGGSGCQARTHWVYQYAQAYAGQVYVQLASPGAGTAEVPTTITWGPWSWRQPVAVHPGDPAQAVGGTVLLFSKLDTSARNPLVVVDTTSPLCVSFGTAGGTSVAPLATVDANQGWVSSSPDPAG
ncbi:helix-turn-helix domain-containing protein [Streptacidiphilus anmyonensis]|uniref:helix-turn-helix domain-containing protein n=1 Tax=Streptacidiphilus anmyonensis TaxID=405782 RepID=UPI000693C48F|nr:helix-turn-helix transcriptional regulator [Streptacidiphilus anmyonensis]